jgi:acetyl-CoA carboxylase biotin carboxylase subunit
MPVRPDALPDPGLVPAGGAGLAPAGVSKVLVCNRGEVAVRIVRACHDLGLPAAVAHSDADRDSRAVQLADESVCIGPGPAGRSYLNVPAILYACARTGADAVHPGYGFLAEDPYFAQACEEAGITFIGPPAEVIRLMGDKIGARAAVAEAGVPISPGSAAALTDTADALACAQRVGYPVLLKAAAGGGRGLRLVESPADMPAALAATRAAARSLFFDDRVYLEKFVPAARHVEVQVLADRYGTVVHLGERDCSIQRRHQKLVEESPSTVLTDEQRAALCEAAVRGARAIGYASAGTVEFLVDGTGRFAFLEMNTRIQVEHPVTEMRTGVDLVEWMIRVAAGERLGFTQADVVPRGHAIECRINAEDVARDWAGSFGRITGIDPPLGAGVRVDTHGYRGYRMPPYYDSLLAKVIVLGETRADALRRMERALAEFDCTGVATTLDFHRQLLRHDVFRAGTHRLDFLDRYLDPHGVLAPGEAR